MRLLLLGKEKKNESIYIAFFDRSTNQMIKGQSELAKTQTRLSSGKEVVNPSDAPEKATAIQRIKSVLNKQESFAGNIEGAENRLIAEETALKRSERYFDAH